MHNRDNPDQSSEEHIKDFMKLLQRFSDAGELSEEALEGFGKFMDEAKSKIYEYADATCDKWWFENCKAPADMDTSEYFLFYKPPITNKVDAKLIIARDIPDHKFDTVDHQCYVNAESHHLNQH